MDKTKKYLTISFIVVLIAVIIISAVDDDKRIAGFYMLSLFHKESWSVPGCRS